MWLYWLLTSLRELCIFLLLIVLKSLAVIQNKVANPIDLYVSIFILRAVFEKHGLEFVLFMSSEAIF